MQRNLRRKIGRVTLRDPQAETLRDRGRQQHALGQRETVADALPRPGPEGNVGESVTRRVLGRRKPLRVEPVRVIPEFGQPVRDVGAESYDRIRLNGIAANHVGIVARARKRVGRRIDPHRFVDNLARVDQVRNVFKRGHPPVERAVDLIMQLRLHVRIAAKTVEEPGHEQRRRLVTRDQQRQHLVPDLLLVHAEARLLVARRQKHPHQVAPGIFGLTALRNHRIDELIERTNVPEYPARAR